MISQSDSQNFVKLGIFHEFKFLSLDFIADFLRIESRDFDFDSFRSERRYFLNLKLAPIIDFCKKI